MSNLPTYGRNEAAVTAREAQVPLADFDEGLNLGASNAPGVGICTQVPNPKLSDWTVLDQTETARDPQGTQHIGGLGIEDGNEGVYYDIQAADYEGGPDLNDTVHFLVADQQAVTDAVYHIASGAVNRGTETVEIGDRVWGTVPVA